MMTAAQRVATEGGKCDVTLQKSCASLQNGYQVSADCPPPPPPISLSVSFFLVKAGRLYSQRSLLSITQTAFEKGGGDCRPGQDFLFPPSLSELDVSMRRWMRMLPIKAGTTTAIQQKQRHESFSF